MRTPVFSRTLSIGQLARLEQDVKRRLMEVESERLGRVQRTRRGEGKLSVCCESCNGREAVLATGARVYPHLPHLRALKIWLCEGCGAYVGVHEHSRNNKPKGTLAGPELREARKRAHAAFDPLWRGGGMTRTQAYKWLTEALGADRGVHIGWADEECCRRIVEVCQGETNHDG